MVATMIAAGKYVFTAVPSLYQNIMFSKSVYVPLRLLCTSTVRPAGRRWREQNDRPGNWTSTGVLTDTPDWSFSDGRPGYLGYSQRKRVLKQMEYAKRIETLLGEVDFAVERHANRQKQKQEKQIAINKRQPKAKYVVPKAKELRTIEED